MKKYVKPTAELLLFDDKINTQFGPIVSGCDCYWDGPALIMDNWDGSGQTIPCSTGGGHASTNPYGIAAADMNYVASDCVR